MKYIVAYREQPNKLVRVTKEVIHDCSVAITDHIDLGQPECHRYEVSL